MRVPRTVPRRTFHAVLYWLIYFVHNVIIHPLLVLPVPIGYVIDCLHDWTADCMDYHSVMKLKYEQRSMEEIEKEIVSTLPDFKYTPPAPDTYLMPPARRYRETDDQYWFRCQIFLENYIYGIYAPLRTYQPFCGHCANKRVIAVPLFSSYTYKPCPHCYGD